MFSNINKEISVTKNNGFHITFTRVENYWLSTSLTDQMKAMNFSTSASTKHHDTCLILQVFHSQKQNFYFLPRPNYFISVVD